MDSNFNKVFPKWTAILTRFSFFNFLRGSRLRDSSSSFLVAKRPWLLIHKYLILIGSALECSSNLESQLRISLCCEKIGPNVFHTKGLSDNNLIQKAYFSKEIPWDDILVSNLSCPKP